MALDTLIDGAQLDSDLTSIADAIRAKTGDSEEIAFPAGFVSAIGDIPSGGGESYDIIDTTAYSVTSLTTTATQVGPTVTIQKTGYYLITATLLRGSMSSSVAITANVKINNTNKILVNNSTVNTMGIISNQQLTAGDTITFLLRTASSTGAGMLRNIILKYLGDTA